MAGYRRAARCSRSRARTRVGNKDRVQIIVSGIVFPCIEIPAASLARPTGRRSNFAPLRPRCHARCYAIRPFIRDCFVDRPSSTGHLGGSGYFARIREFSIPTRFLSFLSVSVCANYCASIHPAMCVLHLSRIIPRVALKSSPANFVLYHHHRCYLV